MERKLSKTFKITSSFYVIYGDYEPIYVGYTNRPVRQRFREHKEDKDFSDYENVEVKDLADEKLTFDFTWDYDQTCRNADEVSNREADLVKKFNTQDSVFQKADGGGQTWAAEKGFVKSNKENPRFYGMSGAEIKSRIEEEKIVSADIGNFVNNMKPQYQSDIGNFVSDMKPQYQSDIGNFVNNINTQYQVDIGHFVSDMKTQYQVDIGNFVRTMKPQYQVDIGHFVSDMKTQYQVDIGNFVNHMKPQYQVDIGSFVNHMKPQYQVDIGSFVNNMKHQYQVDIGNFVSTMKRREQ